MKVLEILIFLALIFVCSGQESMNPGRDLQDLGGEEEFEGPIVEPPPGEEPPQSTVLNNSSESNSTLNDPIGEEENGKKALSTIAIALAVGAVIIIGAVLIILIL